MIGKASHGSITLRRAATASDANATGQSTRKDQLGPTRFPEPPSHIAVSARFASGLPLNAYTPDANHPGTTTKLTNQAQHSLAVCGLEHTQKNLHNVVLHPCVAHQSMNQNISPRSFLCELKRSPRRMFTMFGYTPALLSLALRKEFLIKTRIKTPINAGRFVNWNVHLEKYSQMSNYVWQCLVFAMLVNEQIKTQVSAVHLVCGKPISKDLSINVTLWVTSFFLATKNLRLNKASGIKKTWWIQMNNSRCQQILCHFEKPFPAFIGQHA